MAKIMTETRFQGLPLSGGIGLARVCLFNEHRHSNLPMHKLEAGGVPGELRRLSRAIKVVAARLAELRKDVEIRIGRAEAEIFVAQKMILADKQLGAQLRARIREAGCNAETAVSEVLDFYERQLRQAGDSYIQSRASDIGEVRHRILDVLANMNPSLQCGDQEHCQHGRNRIIVAEELTPFLTLELDAKHTMAFVTERGGVNSHAAILAKALGIPAVSGVEGIHSLLTCGTEVLVNGDSGEVIAWPTEKTIARIMGERGAKVRRLEPVAPVPELQVLASINRAADVAEAIEMLAEGIGLYRTEFEFLAVNRILGEEEQQALYSQVVSAMHGRPLYIRLLDVGGDKALPTLKIPRENNPCLGFRGARFLLGNPELLKAQARALARASAAGQVSLMIPMITGTEQFLELKRLITEAVADLSGVNLRYGAMFEVPSACLEARELLEAADFGSIGSNDLTQYLFAVDRDNALVAHDYRVDQPVFWRLVGEIVTAAREKGKDLSLCGEIAGDPVYVPKLIANGIRRVSVSPRLIPGVRQAVRR